jgi:hypothetical protein
VLVQNEPISRRRCLALIGAGAGATVGVLVPGGKFSASYAAHRQESSASGISANQEILKELMAARVYAQTPAQPRAEFGPASPRDAGSGWQITLSEGWQLSEADDRLTPGRYASDADWIDVTLPCPVQYALMKAGRATLWTDNFFWLAPGEKFTVNGVARLDMTGLDPFSVSRPADSKFAVRVSSWNSPALELQLA